jgi:hypothetical protein
MVATMPPSLTVALTSPNKTTVQAATTLAVRLLAAQAGTDWASVALLSDRTSAQAALDVMARELALGVSAASAAAAAAADRANTEALNSFHLAVTTFGQASPEALAAQSHHHVARAAAASAAAAAAEAWLDFTRAASAADVSTLNASRAADQQEAPTFFEPAPRGPAAIPDHTAATSWSRTHARSVATGWRAALST